MSLKIVILLLFIAVLISLSSALTFLLNDMEIKDSKRTAYALGIRVTLAGILLATIAYGIYSGQLGNTAPWGDHRTNTSKPINP